MITNYGLLVTDDRFWLPITDFLLLTLNTTKLLPIKDYWKVINDYWLLDTDYG
jgi:hypothetical protein